MPLVIDKRRDPFYIRGKEGWEKRGNTARPATGPTAGTPKGGSGDGA